MLAGWFGLIDFALIVAVLLYKSGDVLTTALVSLLAVATFGTVMLL